MALAKQVIPLQFAEGVDTKEDPKVLPPVKLLVLENAMRRQRSKVEKRFGSMSLGQSIIGSSSLLADSDALGIFNDELLQFSKQSVYSYSMQGDNWTDKGSCISAKVRLDDITKNNYEQTQIDHAVVGNMGVLAWEDTRGGVYITVFDYETGARTLVDYQISATATRPRCIAFGANLFVLYVETATNDLKGVKINPLLPLPFPAFVAISSSVSGANPHYDIIAQDTYLAVAYNVQGVTNIRLHRLNENLAVQSTVNITGENATNALSLVRMAASKVLVLWHNATGVRGGIQNVDLTAAVAPFTIEAAANITRITGYRLPDDTGVQVYYEQSAGLTYNTLVRQAFVNNAGTPSGAGVFLRSVGLATKAWAYSPDTTNRGFVGLVHESALQSTFFVTRNDGFVVAKFSYGFAGGLLLRSLPSTVSEREDGVFVFGACTRNPVLDANDTGFLTFKGASVAEIDFTDISNFTGEQLGANYHIIGGVLSTYDGQSVIEHGFHLFPENTSLAQGAGGALTVLSTYNYKIVYAWTDSAGQIHRSSPSPNVQITLTGGNNRVTLTIPTLRLTQKRSTRTNVNIEVYRTEASGVTWYLATSLTSLTFNDTTADTINYVDDLADTVLINREVLYTTGGILDNVGAPSAALIAQWQNRIVLGGLEDDSVLVSKIHEIGRPVEFSEELTIKLDALGGRLRSLGVIDDKLIFLKESAIYYTYGAGPDNTGSSGEFSPPTLVSSDVGCVESNSVVLSPLGLMFKSRKGIYLLGSDMSAPQYIGAPVEFWNYTTVTSAVVCEDLNEVRFSTLENVTLVYNYFFGHWSVHTFGATDAIVWKNAFVYIRRLVGSPSKVVKEVADYFLDIDQKYSLKIKTSWLAFAGVQAIQRVYRAIFLGEFRSAHKLRISVAYNYSQTYHEDHIWNPSVDLDLTKYGDGAFYGSDAVYGGNDSVYQPVVKLGDQKCEAASFLIEDITQDESSYESFNLSSMALLVGGKKGTWKQRTAATM